ncbi:uncharacterized protein RHOBADRAFT_52566 [Rhodotorula graminis WP1]|uniref:HTH APSES-type domain-containing protein n=1 Tax=Rhodotorula graminis (strain WP1) TaxID=578459 RepID=A0A194S7K9_RHOGW|nr:uncharacterized protein RHOBADRAFT_52566 [Rhodotorula graminis WP1]KPV76577.1 hypothetical protein RHOBADRAFT_52566 [Rhodotorula graminis WP1]
MAGRNATKSPQPPVRRSSRQSTPTRDHLASPPPTSTTTTTRTTRSSAVGLPTSSSDSLLPPSLDTLPVSPRGGGPRKSATTRALSPRVAAKLQRPALPAHAANKQLADEAKASKALRIHKVKTQTLHLGDPNGTITIARVKCPVPKGVPGHIIKRFDTDAVSASSLFRAAFPTATEAEETAEMRWIAIGSRGQYGDTKVAGNEGDESKKLSGTWIPSQHAVALAKEYGIVRYAAELIEYVEPTSPQPEGAADDEQATPGSAAATDDSPAARSPRAKRARVSSPLANKSSSASTVQALSGASGPGISILQTLATSDSGAITETTEVKVDVPMTGDAGDEAPQFEDDAAAQIAAAQKLVDSLKKEHVLADLADASHIPDPQPSSASTSSAPSSTKKRALEADDDELPQSGTLADALGTVDNRSFFAKLFRRKANGKRRKQPTQASRETRALPAPSRALAALSSSTTSQAAPEVVLREEDGDQGEARRWAAGFGLAVAVGATAAAPYLFG